MRQTIKTTLAFVLVIFAGYAAITTTVNSQQTDYSRLKDEAERYFAEGSYARAHEVYSRIEKTGLSPVDSRWVAFRLADTNWRAQAATNTADPTKFEQAQKELEQLIRTAEKKAERDLVWAMAHESLGDFFWTRRNQMNWAAAWPHYQQALDWWAGQRNIDQARDRYLSIVFRAAQPPSVYNHYYYTSYGHIPLDVLENALRISHTDNDKVHLHYLIAMTMRLTGGDWESRQRVAEEFEAALKLGKKAEWYDDALFYYAEWMASHGTIRQIDDQQWSQEPDFVKALELYRRLITEFRKGETRYYVQAANQIKNITEPHLGLTVSNIFLPDSEIQFGLQARNLKRIDFSLYKIDLTRDVSFIGNPDEDEGEGEPGNASWLKNIRLEGRAAVKAWSHNLEEGRDHRMVNKELRVERKLMPGAYLLEARSGSRSARDLLLVTDVSLVLKSGPTQALIYFCDALSGKPNPNANVVVWESYQAAGKSYWRRLSQITDRNGLAVFTLKGTAYHSNLFASASIDGRQAFSFGHSYSQGPASDQLRIYAFTDRAAYRPAETVQWKFIARRLAKGAYSTPANETVEYQISDPRGTKVSEGKAGLNSFGSAWGSLELGSDLPLGEYIIRFWSEGRGNFIGQAKLFRLEEYKLPEFKVSVKTPEENGKRRAFRLGEKVDVDVQADYYFGGPVANASVEVVVYQTPFSHYWHKGRDYPWYYSDIERQHYSYYGGQGQVVKRETLKTDATGKVTITFDTPRQNYNQDFEYRIEARVTDSSRREIIASDSVRVTRQRYYVYAQPQRNIYRPQDKVTVDIKALDANNQPISTTGTVKITRDYWYEVWLDPNGREVKGEELRLLREKGSFPPQMPRGRSQRGWRLKFRGYQHDDIATESVKTAADGAAEVSFTPERDGYYRIAWQSSQQLEKRDRFLPPIKADAQVFVATNATTELGYRTNGVEIVVDKDTFRAGQMAPVMLTVPTNDRYVLFSVEGDDLYSYRLIHITGTAKLIEIPIEEKYVPNIFLSAAMVSAAELSLDTEQVVVPPANNFFRSR